MNLFFPKSVLFRDQGVIFRQLKFLDYESWSYQPMSWVGGDDNNTIMITL